MFWGWTSVSSSASPPSPIVPICGPVERCRKICQNGTCHGDDWQFFWKAFVEIGLDSHDPPELELGVVLVKPRVQLLRVSGIGPIR